VPNSDQYFLPFEEAKNQKKRGQDRAISAVSDLYKYKFDRVLREFAAKGLPFSSEDITAIIGLPSQGQNKNNSIGGLMSGAAHMGLIRKFGWTTSKSVNSHAREIRLWIGVEK
jgi:hypothetical protein